MVKVGDGTPWGRADWVKELAPGVVLISTPSHGGYWLAPERCAAMPAELARVALFVERSGGWGRGPGRWFEEDCDAALVVLAFPELFPAAGYPAALIVGARISPVVAVWCDRLPANHPLRGGAPAAPVQRFELTGSDRPADAPGQGALL